MQGADYFGRKPVLVLSLCGVTITTALFGTSKTIWQMILFRCLAGAFSGTILQVDALEQDDLLSLTRTELFDP